MDENGTNGKGEGKGRGTGTNKDCERLIRNVVIRLWMENPTTHLSRVDKPAPRRVSPQLLDPDVRPFRLWLFLPFPSGFAHPKKKDGCRISVSQEKLARVE